MMKRSGIVLLLAATGATASAAPLVCDGILGNSGEGGRTLVRFGLPARRGMGVACDRFGSLWDRAGDGVSPCGVGEGLDVGGIVECAEQ